MLLCVRQVFYAITGQEEIQYKAFEQFGLKDTEIREFFNGPAYLTWSRGARKTRFCWRLSLY